VTDELLRSFLRVDVHNASLLGAPLFHGAELHTSWSSRCDDLARAGERLGEIGCQDALILLRSSFSSPTVLHLLRCASYVSHSALQTFDSLLRDSVQRITNNEFIGYSMATCQSSSQGWGLGGEMCVFACNSRLFGISSTLSLQADLLSGCASLVIRTFKLT